MRTRTLLVLVAVVIVLAATAWAFRADEGALMTWLRSLHGAPGGRH